jgi:non-ribosomal peptide synthetase component F
MSLFFLDAIIEQQMLMTAASMFWLDMLHGCNLDQLLPLPYDRYRLSDELRTDRGKSISFDFGYDLSHHFLAYASSNNVTVEYLALATYYAFLFKLTNGERDLCIGINTDGRYRDELKTVIGLFENTIPLRCQLDPHWSFHQLIDCICKIITSSMRYSYFPLQRILAQHPNVLKPTFLGISFKFQSNDNDHEKTKVMIADAWLHPMSISIEGSKDGMMSEFDFSPTIDYDLNINRLSCTINASLDLFNAETVDKVAQRFHSMLYQLFQFNTNDQMMRSIYELSLIVPDDRLLMQSMNNTQVLFPSVSCIHHEFVCQVMKHPQKLAVELDDQSLTYSELLYYVQVLSLNILRKQGIAAGDIICQCVERSLSMVSSLKNS